MTGRWRNPSAFRADPAAASASRPSPRQTLALVAVLVLVAGAIATVSYLVRPERARAFDLFHGSLFLADQTAPVAVDLATGKPTLRLLGADKQVGIGSGDTLGVVPLTDRTLLLNQMTGEFNMVDSGGFVVKHDGGGVPLAPRPRPTSAMGVPTDDGQAYIVRTGPTGGTDVYLVSQPTVEAAIGATRSVRPRASTSMPGAASTAAGGAAAAGDALWLLVGSANSHTIRQLQVPAGSSTGATLAITDHGTVSGPAAIATSGTGSSGTPVVGVASAGRIRLFGSGSTRTVTFRSPAGLDTVLSATSETGRLAYLLHGSGGWSVVSVNADGSGLRQPVALTKIAAGAQFAQPAVSNGALYTLDRTTGDILRIGDDGSSAVLATYPLTKVDGKVVEAADYGDAYLVSRGARVVVNSTSHTNALMLFTDGSHRPATIAKSSAVNVNAAGGADALTKALGTAQPGTSPSGPAKPKPEAIAPINNKIDCKTATQKPHIPVIQSAVPGSRTVALRWTYPVLDPQDCYPSTYVVSVKLISNGAPQPPASVTVQSQTGTDLSGLFPSTQYEITVTAYINQQGTGSVPVRITTGPEGPAAPTNLAVTTDSSGDWVVNFDSCGGIDNGCVQAQSWTVTPSFCDGRGLSAPPAAQTETADPTSRAQPAVTYKGSDALLGRGLQFQVQGTGGQGQAGTPSAKSACVYSWAPPDAAALTLQASTAPVSQLGQSTTATVSLNLGSDPVRAAGGVGATFNFQLLSGGTVVKQSGPTTQPTATFTGIQPGVSYQAAAVVAPPRHAEAAVHVGPIDVQAAHAPWPALSVSVDQPQNSGALQAVLTVHISGLTSADAGGETFDLVGDSGLVCGNSEQTSGWDHSTGIDPGQPLSFTVDRSTYFGACQIHVQLAQDAGSGTAVFGSGTTSASATSNTVSIDPPQLLGVSSNDFTASWDGTANGQSQVQINYTGGNPLLQTFASNWTVAVSNPQGGSCGGYQNSARLGDVAVPQSCVDQYGASGTGWTVHLSFTYFGSTQGPFTASPIHGGAAPTFNTPQCDPTKASLTATWTGTPKNPGVRIAAGNVTAVSGCSQWIYVVSGPQTQNCGQEASHSTPPVTVAITCNDAPAAPGWKVTITYHDAGGSTQSYTIDQVGGKPPS